MPRQGSANFALRAGARLIALLFLSCAAVPAQADRYSRDGYSFDIPDLTLAQVQDAVGSSMTFLVGDLHPYWERPPCYANADASGANAAALTDLFNALNARLPSRVQPCAQNDGPSVSYYFAHGDIGAAERKTLLALDGNPANPPENLAEFIDGKASCVATFSFARDGFRYVAIKRALVAVNLRGMSSDDERRCLFLTAVSVLGLGMPAKLPDPHGAKPDWKAEVEFNLLALFVLQVMAEDQRGWDSASIDAKVRSVLFVMHELGRTG